MIYHVLMFGRPLCDAFPGLAPFEWPRDHRWVRIEDRAAATCPVCVYKAAFVATDKEGHA